MDKIKEDFYENPKLNLLVTDNLEYYVFETCPSVGATVLDPKS